MGIVLRDVLDLRLHLVQVLLQPDHFPLLFLNEGYGGEDALDDALILLLVVLIQPQIVHHHKHPSAAPFLQHVQERPHTDQDGQGLTLDHALPILVLDIELRAFHTVCPRLVAGRALPVTVLMANSMDRQLVPHTSSGLLVGSTRVSHEMVVLDAGSAVIGELAFGACLGAPEQNFNRRESCCQDEVELFGVDEDLEERHTGLELLQEGEGIIGEGVDGNLLGFPAEDELAPVVQDVEFEDVGLVGLDGEFGDIGTPVELVETNFGGKAMHFHQIAQEVDFEALECEADGLAEFELTPILPIEVEAMVTRH